MELNHSPTVAVCVLAHNEERSIEQTLLSVLNTTRKDFNITVYSNGCTDRTCSIVNQLSLKNSRIKNVEISTPSKVNAWNRAFLDCDEDILVFCDGDIVPSVNAINHLVDELMADPKNILVSTRLFPLMENVSLEKKLIGFIQLPLKHEFLSGGMYAFKRAQLLERFREEKLEGIPLGITAEDYFLEHLVANNGFIISKVKNYYEPPSFHDYIRYLARVKWQNLQLLSIFGEHPQGKISQWQKLKNKFLNQHEIFYLLISIPAVISRAIFKVVFAKRIDRVFKELGPITKDGENILRVKTRANSTK